MTEIRKILVCSWCAWVSLASLCCARSQELDQGDFQPLTHQSITVTPLPKLEPESNVQSDLDQDIQPVRVEPSEVPFASSQPAKASTAQPSQAKLTRLDTDLESEFLKAYQQLSSPSASKEKQETAEAGPSLTVASAANSYPAENHLAIDNTVPLAKVRVHDFVPESNQPGNEISAALPHHDLGQSGLAIRDGQTNDTQPIWWSEKVAKGLLPDNSSQPIDLNTLVYQAIKNSPRIQAISQTPMIRELQVIEADSAFDAVGFVRSNFNDRNDPVGNTLVTGGPPFLEDHIWSGDFGVKRKTRTGADVELGQKLGFQNSNSRFFLPQDQGTATLALNISQPLLRGRGRFINESQIFIAQANTGAAWSVFSNELQDELEKVTQTYWQLFYDRSLYLQKRRSVERGQQILDILQARQELDSMPSQVARAKSAVELRKTQLANAFRDIRNSETEIRRRIADKDWMAAQTIELIPAEPSKADPTEIPLEQVVHTALENRPEIKEAMQRAKAAGIQNQIGENELLPELSLLVGSYVSALNGETGVLNSWDDQFRNKPGYNAGLNFEMPYGNRAARSRLSQQKLQLAKIRAEVEETIQKVLAESQIAHRRVLSAIQTRDSALVSIEASRGDLAQQASRWEQFGLVEGDFSEGQNPVILLNQVLDAQERLAAAELIYAQADLELKVSEIALQRTMGTLLMYQNVNFSSSSERDQPYMQIDQVGVQHED